ncbi:cytochrome c3 family protein, partial [Methylocystis sp.]|uniref:cytochrome c3 family protein n=1 Tax=Methylocystis sp. TaxID=1911079 RepID=UPI003DA2C6CA
MNHSGIISGCATCHDNVRALGKSPAHIKTDLPCETCHKSTDSFAGAFYQHKSSDTNCSSFHNGTIATGKTTPPHIPVSVQCSNCHSNTATSFTTYTMNHAAVSASRCDACHNGSYTGEGTKGALGSASYPGHVATAGRDCGTCHTKAAPGFTSWAGATYAHAAGDT